MTNLLMRRFVAPSNGADSKRVRAAAGRLSGIVGIICNLLLFALKLAVGTISGSVSITADAMNNLSDASSSIVTLLGFHLAEKPADEHHPFGHARFEYLSGLAVAGLILIIGYELAQTSIGKILNPSPVDLQWVTVGVLVGSIAVKFWLSRFNTKLGVMIDSATLMATAADSRNDCLATGAVLVAAVIERTTSWQVDGIMGLACAAFILWSGCNMAKDTISPLLGESTDPEQRQLIADFVSSWPKVLGYHDLMVHDYGPGQRFASLHVEMDKNEDAVECHEIIDDMERTMFKEHGIHLVVHYDPVVANDPAADRMRNLVTAILRVRDPRLSIHDFRMVPGAGHTNLLFDLAVPSDLNKEHTKIQQALESALNDLGEGTYYTVITFDNAAFN